MKRLRRIGNRYKISGKKHTMIDKIPNIGNQPIKCVNEYGDQLQLCRILKLEMNCIHLDMSTHSVEKPL